MEWISELVSVLRLLYLLDEATILVDIIQALSRILIIWKGYWKWLEGQDDLDVVFDDFYVQDLKTDQEDNGSVDSRLEA